MWVHVCECVLKSLKAIASSLYIRDTIDKQYVFHALCEYSLSNMQTLKNEARKKKCGRIYQH